MARVALGDTVERVAKEGRCVDARVNVATEGLNRESAAPVDRKESRAGPVIEVTGLRKTYDGADAVAGIELTVNRL